ncbi:hypothetical protein SARC_03543 [Sphaeroforma arctica JP610]|uniref:Uncharacterized protein n=1 Tax=Sphaeroforma arctica JP610 TaxID=667725 RepID=A0A0L0G7N9_9EUKA|nr:hypothetical protein SARC_03543 [Sphaeroforma arctica JP610]KNC84243.1 hypothetical protein SARC_03543 [Sphaeroforma arctica JP610]|eukprot:XP_014158145.1 hypothetical protein SARC_03543 [Sphaeroforma arctica JP610]
MNDISLTIMIWVGYLLFVAYFILWFTVSPITTTVMGSCHTSSNMFFYISLVLLAIGLILVSVMSYKTRTVPVHYGEPNIACQSCSSSGRGTPPRPRTLPKLPSYSIITVVIKNKETSKDTDGNDNSNDPSITDTVFLKHRRTKLRAELIALQERVLEQQQELGIELQLPDTPGAENSNMVPLTALNTETMWNMLSPGVLNSGASSRMVPADHNVPDR